MSSLNESDIEVLLITESITSLISMLASSLVLITYLSFKQLRTFAFRLVCFMSIADLFKSSSGVINMFPSNSSYEQLDIVCQLQAFLSSFGIISSFMWIDIITWVLYSTVVLKKVGHESSLRFYAALGYGLPFLTNTA